MYQMNNMKNNQGFTLVELMITVAIIGILAAIALPSYNRYIERGYLAQAHTELVNLNNQIKTELVKKPSLKVSDALKDLDKKIDKTVTDRYTFHSKLENENTGRRYLISAVPKSETGYTLAMWIDSLGNAYRCSDAASAKSFSTDAKSCEPVSNKKK